MCWFFMLKMDQKNKTPAGQGGQHFMNFFTKFIFFKAIASLNQCFYAFSYPQMKFLDQCSSYLTVSGSTQLIFGKSIFSPWLTLFWPLLTAKLKPGHWANFYIRINLRKYHKWEIRSTQKSFFHSKGIKIASIAGHLFCIFPPWPRELLLSTRIGL